MAFVQNFEEMFKKPITTPEFDWFMNEKLIAINNKLDIHFHTNGHTQTDKNDYDKASDKKSIKGIKSIIQGIDMIYDAVTIATIYLQYVLALYTRIYLEAMEVVRDCETPEDIQTYFRKDQALGEIKSAVIVFAYKAYILECLTNSYFNDSGDQQKITVQIASSIVEQAIIVEFVEFDKFVQCN